MEVWNDLKIVKVGSMQRYQHTYGRWNKKEPPLRC